MRRPGPSPCQRRRLLDSSVAAFGRDRVERWARVAEKHATWQPLEDEFLRYTAPPATLGVAAREHLNNLALSPLRPAIHLHDPTRRVSLRVVLMVSGGPSDASPSPDLSPSASNRLKRGPLAFVCFRPSNSGNTELNTRVVTFARARLRVRPEVALAAVGQHGSALRWASARLRGSEELVDVASRTFFFTRQELAELGEDDGGDEDWEDEHSDSSLG